MLVAWEIRTHTQRKRERESLRLRVFLRAWRERERKREREEEERRRQKDVEAREREAAAASVLEQPTELPKTPSHQQSAALSAPASDVVTVRELSSVSLFDRNQESAT